MEPINGRVNSYEETLYNSIEKDDDIKVEEFINKLGLQIDQIRLGGSRWTPLTLAIHNKNIKLVNKFIKMGADVNQKDDQRSKGQGNTPIQQAIIDFDYDVFKKVINEYPDVEGAEEFLKKLYNFEQASDLDSDSDESMDYLSALYLIQTVDRIRSEVFTMNKIELEDSTIKKLQVVFDIEGIFQSNERQIEVKGWTSKLAYEYAKNLFTDYINNIPDQLLNETEKANCILFFKASFYESIEEALIRYTDSQIIAREITGLATPNYHSIYILAKKVDDFCQLMICNRGFGLTQLSDSGITIYKIPDKIFQEHLLTIFETKGTINELYSTIDLLFAKTKEKILSMPSQQTGSCTWSSLIAFLYAGLSIHLPDLNKAEVICYGFECYARCETWKEVAHLSFLDLIESDQKALSHIKTVAELSENILKIMRSDIPLNDIYKFMDCIKSLINIERKLSK